MYCYKCGRFTEELSCSKCNLPIDEETRIIAEKYRPTGFFSFIGFFFPLTTLLIELFIKQKSPRDRAAIECAKSRIIYTGIVLALMAGMLLAQFDMIPKIPVSRDFGIILGIVLMVMFLIGAVMGTLTWIYMLLTINEENKKAMGLWKKKKNKKHQKETVSYPQNP